MQAILGSRPIVPQAPASRPNPKWRRVATDHRLLVIEHESGSIEEVGFVRVLTLCADYGDEVRTCVEFQDAHGVPRACEVAEEDFDGPFLLTASHIRGDGQREVWHFDEAALAKIRQAIGRAA